MVTSSASVSIWHTVIIDYYIFIFYILHANEAANRQIEIQTFFPVSFEP